ncbi:hypothetical protein TOPH_09127 [Tolypocladium ophioglossoides CBS 100239]|uniref:Uncharacterized protein n=1 Tax=Tolypocladium ophioglossoides (strain CBS 100239) TaxID=1163406 RepID=A0A0L0MWL0_TOLOC|nr:hypothetical protein TOPH_09127 [Tolypocladium ophioglossoides CBS 100239]
MAFPFSPAKPSLRTDPSTQNSTSWATATSKGRSTTKAVARLRSHRSSRNNSGRSTKSSLTETTPEDRQKTANSTILYPQPDKTCLQASGIGIGTLPWRHGRPLRGWHSRRGTNPSGLEESSVAICSPSRLPTTRTWAS